MRLTINFIGLFLYLIEIFGVAKESFDGDFYTEFYALDERFFLSNASNFGDTVFVLFEDDFL